MNRKSEQQEIVYKINKSNAKKAIVLYFILSLSCIFLYFYSSHNLWESNSLVLMKVLAYIIGIGGVGFAVLGLLFIRRLFSNGPYLVINNNGIHDYASGIFSGAGFIDWNEIDDIKLSKYHNLPCVELVLKNREQFLKRFSIFERINRSKFLGYPAIAFRGPMLPVEPHIMIEQIMEYKKLIVE